METVLVCARPDPREGHPRWDAPARRLREAVVEVVGEALAAGGSVGVLIGLSAGVARVVDLCTWRVRVLPVESVREVVLIGGTRRELDLAWRLYDAGLRVRAIPDTGPAAWWFDEEARMANGLSL